MRKKLTGIIFALCMGLLTTSCGTNDYSSREIIYNQDNSSHHEAHIPQTTMDSTPTNSSDESESYSSPTKVSSEVGKTVTINRIGDYLKSENRLVVYTANDDKSTYVLDENGIVLAKMENYIANYANGFFFGMSSHISESEWEARNFDGSGEQNGSLYQIFDLSGNLLFDENDRIVTSVSKSGYMITFDILDELAGKSEQCRIVDMNGNTIYTFEDKGWFRNAAYMCDDIFYYEGALRENTFLIDAATGKKLQVQPGRVNTVSHLIDDINGESVLLDRIRIGDRYYNKDLSGDYVEVSGTILTDNTVYRDDCIYDFSGKELKNLHEGGVLAIAYSDQAYYVVSKTDFIYTLDTDFQYIAEPQKANGIRGLTPTSSGIWCSDLYNNAVLMDRDLNITELEINTCCPDFDYAVTRDGNLYSYKDNKMIIVKENG